MTKYSVIIMQEYIVEAKSKVAVRLMAPQDIIKTGQRGRHKLVVKRYREK